MITNKEKNRLLSLANQQVEIAHSPAMEQLRRDWEAHGRFDPAGRPMLTIELWTFAEDLLPQMMECQEKEARDLEWMLLSNLVNHTLFGDDTLVKDYLPVEYDSWFVPFGIQEHKQESGGLAYQYVHEIEDLGEDFHKLKKSTYGIDKQSADRKIEYYHGIFGDLLPGKLRASCMALCPTQSVVKLMSMESMYVALYDYPELFQKMLEQMTDDYLEYVSMLEQENLILPTYGEAHLNQGSYCFNDVLPVQGDHLTAKDVWLYMDSQESAGLSPEMYLEFIAPYYKKVSDHFGLFSYGCCEAVDPIWDSFCPGWTICARFPFPHGATSPSWGSG